MTIEKLRDAVNTEPFEPFVIVMGDGTRYRVTSREMVAMSPKASRTFLVAYGDEDHAVLDLLLVTALEFRKTRRYGSRGDNGRH